MITGFRSAIDWSKSMVLKNTKRLAGGDLDHITICPDLTKLQRKEEDDMAKEAERRNAEELTEEDASKNLIWKVVGRKGQKRLIKTVEMNNQAGGSGARGGSSRGQSRGRTRGRGTVSLRRGAGGSAEVRKRTREDDLELDQRQGKRGPRGLLPRTQPSRRQYVPAAQEAPQAARPALTGPPIEMGQESGDEMTEENGEEEDQSQAGATGGPEEEEEETL